MFKFTTCQSSVSLCFQSSILKFQFSSYNFQTWTTNKLFNVHTLSYNNPFKCSKFQASSCSKPVQNLKCLRTMFTVWNHEVPPNKIRFGMIKICHVQHSGFLHVQNLRLLMFSKSKASYVHNLEKHSRATTTYHYLLKLMPLHLQTIIVDTEE